MVLPETVETTATRRSRGKFQRLRRLISQPGLHRETPPHGTHDFNRLAAKFQSLQPEFAWGALRDTVLRQGGLRSAAERRTE